MQNAHTYALQICNIENVKIFTSNLTHTDCMVMHIGLLDFL